jgi:endo-1,4-beta-xylanase
MIGGDRQCQSATLRAGRSLRMAGIAVRAACGRARIVYHNGNPHSDHGWGLMRPTWSGDNLSLGPRDMTAWARAEQAIQANRCGNLLLRVVDGNGQPLSGVPVRYEQRRHSFRFGAFYPYHGRTYDLLEEAGINAATLWLGWSHVEPRPQLYNWGYLERVWNPSALKRRHLQVTAHALNWFKPEWNVVPGYLRDIDPDALPERVYEHVSVVAKRWAPLIDRFEIVNEPLWREANLLSLTKEQMVRVALAAALAVRDVLPRAQIEVNFAEVSRMASYVVPPFEFLDALDEAHVPYDCIGLQALENSYTITTPATYYRAKGLWAVLQTVRQYGRLGKPLHISTLAVPSEPPREHVPAYFDLTYGPWDEAKQAYYLDAAYSLLFAEREVEGITWWCPVDGRLALVPGGGLLREDLSPKPAYQALQDWMRRHTSRGQAHTDDEGTVVLEGFAGEYQITVGNGDGGKSLVERIEVPVVRDVTVVLKR